MLSVSFYVENHLAKCLLFHCFSVELLRVWCGSDSWFYFILFFLAVPEFFGLTRFASYFILGWPLFISSDFKFHGGEFWCDSCSFILSGPTVPKMGGFDLLLLTAKNNQICQNQVASGRKRQFLVIYCIFTWST